MSTIPVSVRFRASQKKNSRTYAHLFYYLIWQFYGLALAELLRLVIGGTCQFISILGVYNARNLNNFFLSKNVIYSDMSTWEMIGSGLGERMAECKDQC